MVILRRKNKCFSDPNPQAPNSQEVQRQEMITSKDLQLENMKMQRQIYMNQRMRQKLEAQERNEKIKTIAKIQQAEAKKDETERDNQVRIQKMQESNQSNPAERNWNLVKSKAKTTAPVPMKH